MIQVSLNSFSHPPAQFEDDDVATHLADEEEFEGYQAVKPNKGDSKEKATKKPKASEPEVQPLKLDAKVRNQEAKITRMVRSDVNGERCLDNGRFSTGHVILHCGIDPPFIEFICAGCVATGHRPVGLEPIPARGCPPRGHPWLRHQLRVGFPSQPRPRPCMVTS